MELTDEQIEYAQTLIEGGLISLERLQEWLMQQELLIDLGGQLVDEGLIDAFDMIHCLAKKLSLPIVSDIELELSAVPHPELDFEFSSSFFCIPLAKKGVEPFPIALANPYDSWVQEELIQLLGIQSIKIHLATHQDILNELSEWVQPSPSDSDQAIPEVHSQKGISNKDESYQGVASYRESGSPRLDQPIDHHSHLEQYKRTIVDAQLLDEDQLNQWLSKQPSPPFDLGWELVQAGLISSFDLSRVVAKALNLKVIGDIELDLYGEPHPSLTETHCESFGCLPLSNRTIDPFPIAVCNPFNDHAILELKRLLNVKDLKMQVANHEELFSTLYRSYEGFTGYSEITSTVPPENHQASEKSEKQASKTQHISPMIRSNDHLFPDWNEQYQNQYDHTVDDQIRAFEIFLKSLYANK